MNLDMEETELLSMNSSMDTEPALQRTLEKQLLNANEHYILTPFGNVKVAAQGQPGKPAIVTCHDIGLNHITCFQEFFNSTTVKPLLEHFQVYHVNLPGQHDGATPIQPESAFSTMDELANVIDCVYSHFRLKCMIGFGFGAGANILARFALLHPHKCEGLVLLNCTSTQCGWVEWGYQKFHGRSLKSGNMTNFIEDYLLWHWFGRQTKNANIQLVSAYREHIKTINLVNLSMFIDAYIGRSDLGIIRCTDPNMKDKVRAIRCPVLLVSGDHGPMVDDTIDMNSKMNPTTCSFVKFSECGGMILEEQPAKLLGALRLFLQGLGYVPFLGQKRLVTDATQQYTVAVTTAVTVPVALVSDANP